MVFPDNKNSANRTGIGSWQVCAFDSIVDTSCLSFIDGEHLIYPYYNSFLLKNLSKYGTYNRRSWNTAFYFDEWNHTIKNPVLNYKYYRIISGLHIDFYVETW